MKKIKRMLQSLLGGALLLAAPQLAQAQETYGSVRVEPGVAIPLGDPQEDRFTPGFALAVKPELSIVDVIGIGPSGSVAVFNSNVLGIDSPTIWGLGGFIRVKRPHGQEWNSDTGADAVSPYAEAELTYVRTGPLNRLGYSVAVGAAWPLDEDRIAWLGPFVRYQHVYQPDDVPGMNTNDSHTLIFGASLELGAPHTKPPVVKEPEVPSKPEVKPPVKPEIPKQSEPVIKEVEVELQQVIQFAWDSDKLDATATQQLDAVVAKINGAKSYKAIKVEGHASSEGQVVHNNKLSQRRANSVVEYLVQSGISRDKLTAVSFGSQVPVADNATEAGRVKNRRAEFVVKFTILQEVKP